MKHLLTCFLLILKIASAQVQSGEVTYKVIPPKDIKHFLDTAGVEQNIIKNRFVKEFKKAHQAAPYLSFQLQFNKSEAIFKSNTQMKSDNGINLNHIPKLSEPMQGTFYTNTSENILIRKFKSFGKTTYLKKKTDTLSWKIQNEERVILGYRCSKATAPIRYNDIKSGTVTAWFCPDLPFNYGPAEFAGLPGLILGLERSHTYFYADKIDLSEKNKKIKRPDYSGKTITETEYYQKSKEKVKEMKERSNR